MPIETREQAEVVSRWARNNPNDPRYPKAMAELKQWAATNIPQTPPSAPRTAEGRAVMQDRGLNGPIVSREEMARQAGITGPDPQIDRDRRAAELRAQAAQEEAARAQAQQVASREQELPDITKAPGYAGPSQETKKPGFWDWRTGNDAASNYKKSRFHKWEQELESMFNPFSERPGPARMALEGAKGIGDVALSLGTGFLGSGYGGASAVLDTVIGNPIREAAGLNRGVPIRDANGKVVFNEDGTPKMRPIPQTERMTDIIRAGQEAFTYSPRSDAGAKVGKGVAVPMEYVDQKVKDLAWMAGNEDPLQATVWYTLANVIAPGKRALGAEGTAGRIAQNAELKKLNEFYRSKGIDLGADDMEAAMQRWAGREFQDVPRERGHAMRDVPGQVRTLAEGMQEDIANLEMYPSLSDATIKMTGADKMVDSVQKMLDRVVAPTELESKGVKYGLEQLELLARQAKSHKAAKRQNVATNYRGYQNLMDMRKRIESAGMNKAAKDVMLGGLDAYLMRQIEGDLIRKDPFLSGSFSLAADLRKKYQENFSAPATIYRMATDKNASVTTFRSLIYGMAETGMKGEAIDVIRGLKKIFGEDSPQMNAMRLEFLSDALEPLRAMPGEKPNIRAWVDHYEKSLRNNKELIDELSPYSRDGLEQMYKLGQQHLLTQGRIPFSINPLKIIPRILVGHSIARHGAMVQTSQMLAEALLGRRQGQVRRELLAKISGHDSLKPLFADGTTRLLGAWAAALDDEYAKQGGNQDEER